MQRYLHPRFIDYEKAFGQDKHENRGEILRNINTGGKDLKFITNLCWSQTAAVRVGEGESKWFKLKRGVRQMCVMSPDLFSLYGEVILREIKDTKVFIIGVRNLNNTRRVDDAVLVANAEDKLLVDTVKGKSKQYKVNINAGKTKNLMNTK